VFQADLSEEDVIKEYSHEFERAAIIEVYPIIDVVGGKAGEKCFGIL